MGCLEEAGDIKKTGGMGFRDLHLFNQALLANQVWKIIQRPHSMIFRLLKARYFKDGDIFSANRGTKPSYGWNSLRFGRDLLKTGIQVAIGNGENTKIGLDPWLPTTPPWPPTLLPMIEPTLAASFLIDPITRQWDETKISNLIDPTDHQKSLRSISHKAARRILTYGVILKMVNTLSNQGIGKQSVQHSLMMTQSLLLRVILI